MLRENMQAMGRGLAADTKYKHQRWCPGLVKD